MGESLTAEAAIRYTLRSSSCLVSYEERLRDTQTQPAESSVDLEAETAVTEQELPFWPGYSAEDLEDDPFCRGVDEDLRSDHVPRAEENRIFASVSADGTSTEEGATLEPDERDHAERMASSIRHDLCSGFPGRWFQLAGDAHNRRRRCLCKPTRPSFRTAVSDIFKRYSRRIRAGPRYGNDR